MYHEKQLFRYFLKSLSYFKDSLRTHNNQIMTSVSLCECEDKTQMSCVMLRGIAHKVLKI